MDILGWFRKKNKPSLVINENGIVGYDQSSNTMFLIENSVVEYETFEEPVTTRIISKKKKKDLQKARKQIKITE